MTDCHTLLVSDIHIGSKICRADKIIDLLKTARYKTLIINGDLFDSAKTHLFNEKHWQIVSIIGEIAKTRKVLMVRGNHGRELDSVARNMGIEIHDDYEFTLGNKRFLCLHGDQFDPFVTHLPRITKAFTHAFYLIQELNGDNQKPSMAIKRFSKRILGMSSRRQQRLALHHAARRQAHVVICSHTHLPHIDNKEDILFINSGSFCDNPSSYVAIDQHGNSQLQHI